MVKRGYDEEIAHNPHDGLIKRIFTKPEAAAVELRSALPAALTEQLDWDTLHVESGSFVDPKLRPRHSDILYSMALRDSERRVHVSTSSTLRQPLPLRRSMSSGQRSSIRSCGAAGWRALNRLRT